MKTPSGRDIASAKKDTEFKGKPTPKASIPELSMHHTTKEAGNESFLLRPQAEHSEDTDLAEASQRVAEKYKEVSDLLKKGM